MDTRRQLIVYRALFEAGAFGWPEHACRGCSMVADQVRVVPAHLTERGGGYPQTPPYEWWNWHDEYEATAPADEEWLRRVDVYPDRRAAERN
jgi:predicted dithiol-disulfide oxidoreductase (DUF899 family)